MIEGRGGVGVGGGGWGGGGTECDAVTGRRLVFRGRGQSSLTRK